jgi:dephospho-CoA kinase
MYLIALTGGIASGKSLVSERLAQLGAIVIDADLLAREVVEPGTKALAEIAAEFGQSVIQADGALNRSALGSMIFQDPQLRHRLNAITHPQISRRAQKLIAEAGRSAPQAVVVYDVPLLAESSTARELEFDLIAVVHADWATRLRRLIELRGMSEDEAIHRLNSQASDSQRLGIADVVIENNGTRDEALTQVDKLWEMVSRSK